MNPNYQFWINYAVARQPRKVLDLGCGHGLVVSELRARGIEAYGSEVFFGRAEVPSDDALAEMIANGIVRHHGPDQPLPFPADMFDLVMSNMVLEHVEDIDFVVSEMDRVLTADGTMRHHFPTKHALREGHIGIPLVPSLPRGRGRLAYTTALRALGVGSARKEQESARDWAERQLAWVDRYCFYRSYREIEQAFAGFEIQPGEADYFRHRAQGRWFAPMFTRAEGAQAIAMRRIAFAALEMRRR